MACGASRKGQPLTKQFQSQENNNFSRLSKKKINVDQKKVIDYKK